MLTAHVLVKNEHRFIWYSVMSVINHVDKVLLWDTGSGDGTLEIIEQILKCNEAKGKVFFKSFTHEPFDEELMRQKMLDETPSGWFIVVDGDEVWWNDSIKKVAEVIETNGKNIESIVVPTINVVGDMFHFQETQAGNYHLAGRVGHYAIRAINRNIKGLHSYGRHGIWGWVDEEKRQIQDRDKDKIVYTDAPYLHTTYLPRSSSRKLDASVLKRSFKRKFEIGIEFPLDFYYPEVFFRQRPEIVPNVWEPMTQSFKFRATFETPLRKTKRRIMVKKVGY